ncbi:MAG: hypothetical protein CVU57_12705 [Deltaproteobacteria bacterium HGW-Deltaproteobacteria-15]|jgi:hypothetical protein|nr:MAG: hypothetical protein CVU57_12705 [Deltaproteobacteria bacterium HGW-Deltaproteobacteria-15]
MKWVEVIQLRCCGAVEHKKNLDISLKLRMLTEELLSSLLSEDGGSWLREVKIFHNAAITTDVCLHLHWDKALASRQGSTVGFCIADSLKEFGLVDRSVWVEEPA